MSPQIEQNFGKTNRQIRYGENPVSHSWIPDSDKPWQQNLKWWNGNKDS